MRTTPSSIVKAVAVPMPVQVVIDDVGWWSGEDGHERHEPFRTGIQRNHAPEDYAAIALLGRQLNMRPQAAMILCEWDTQDVLRQIPSATWMCADWDNAKWVGAWLEEAGDVLRRNRDHVEIALHGIGHEYWIDGRMARAEWHDADGRMRPREDVKRHIEYFQRVLDQHQLGPFPESFVPAAFLHRFGDGEGGLPAILREAGVRYISTPFRGMHASTAPSHKRFGVDAGLITVDRGADLCRWYDIAPDPQGQLDGAICGMHWPNLLHPHPQRNREVVDRWVGLLRPYGQRLDTMLAPNTKAFCTQLVYHECARVERGGEAIRVELAGMASLPILGLDDCFAIRVKTSMPARFSSSDLDVTATDLIRQAGGFLYEVILKRRPGQEVAHVAAASAH